MITHADHPRRVPGEGLDGVFPNQQLRLVLGSRGVVAADQISGELDEAHAFLFAEGGDLFEKVAVDCAAQKAFSHAASLRAGSPVAGEAEGEGKPRSGSGSGSEGVKERFRQTIVTAFEVGVSVLRRSGDRIADLVKGKLAVGTLPSADVAMGA